MIKILGFALFCACLSVQAATVTVTGDDVQFTFDDSSVFGTASVVGNSIFFLPTNFKAQSLNGDGAATANTTLQIRIEVITDGFALRELHMLEQGDYLLNGAGAIQQIVALFEHMQFPQREAIGDDFDADLQCRVCRGGAVAV